MERCVTLSLVLLLVLTSSTVHATETVTRTQIKKQSRPDPYIRLALDFSWDRYRSTTGDFLSSVTMRELPAGSLLVDYEGVQGLAVKHARSQFRRAVRRFARDGSMVLEDDSDPFRSLFEQVDHYPINTQANGEWWQRSWLESFPEEKGGAPTTPYVHTYGKEIFWRLGPLAVSNTLKVRFDYIAFFELNPDPVSHEHGERAPPLALDVSPPRSTTIGNWVRFNVKPRIRVGLPQQGDFLGALRMLSLEATFEVYRRRAKVIDGNVELRWRPDDGLVLTAEVALVSW